MELTLRTIVPIPHVLPPTYFPIKNKNQTKQNETAKKENESKVLFGCQEKVGKTKPRPVKTSKKMGGINTKTRTKTHSTQKF